MARKSGGNKPNPSQVVHYREHLFRDWGSAKKFFYELSEDWIFRGQSDSSWELATSLERQIRHYINQSNSFLFHDSELRLLDEFKRGAHLYLREAYLPQYDLDWLALMQHYGIPTRLLDFTRSPYVASFFAFAKPSNVPSRAIWALDWKSVSDLAEEQLKSNKELLRILFGESELSTSPDLAWQKGSNVFMKYLKYAPKYDHSIVRPVRGFISNERMLVQQGVFVVPTNIERTFMENVPPSLPESEHPFLYKIVLPNSVQTQVLTDLQWMNINDASLFPGLDGYARAIASQLVPWVRKMNSIDRNIFSSGPWRTNIMNGHSSIEINPSDLPQPFDIKLPPKNEDDKPPTDS